MSSAQRFSRARGSASRPGVHTFSLLSALVLALGVFAPGCDEGSDDDNREDTSSGGEDTEERAELEAPEGSSEPDDDGSLPDGDLESEADSGSDSGAGGGSTGDSGTADADPAGDSPWGRPESESGRPLPPRRPMNGSARDAYRRGLRAAAAGNADAARQAFQRALSADGNAFKAAYNLGVLADRAGNDSQALEFYQRALRMQADYERAILGIARIYLRRGDSARAVSFVRPLAERWERNLHVQAIYGDVLVGANRPEEAIEAARRALRRDERFVPAMVVLVKANLSLSRNELAESILNQAIETDNDVAELHYLRARIQQAEGDLAPALQSYQRAIELEPSYMEARMALGLQQLAAGNYPQALAQFRAAAGLAPTVPAVRLALGDAYRATKAWQQAKGEFDRVQEMEPRNAEVHFNLGVLYREAGDGFPNLTKVQAYQRGVTEFNRYRELMGPRLPREDPSQPYLDELGRLIEREERAAERARAREQRARDRAAREAAEGGGTE